MPQQQSEAQKSFGHDLASLAKTVENGQKHIDVAEGALEQAKESFKHVLAIADDIHKCVYDKLKDPKEETKNESENS